jgi:hypothetical protein
MLVLVLGRPIFAGAFRTTTTGTGAVTTGFMGCGAATMCTGTYAVLRRTLR